MRDQSQLLRIYPLVEDMDLSLGFDQRVPELDERINDLVSAGGKRLRPLLTMIFAEAFGVESTKALSLARLTELTHAATLLHDDVIDQAKMRRAKPSLNEKLSNTHAVLAGDALLARVMKEMAEVNEPSVLKDLAETLDQLSRGEWLQLESRFQIQRKRHQLLQIAELKTSSLITWCVLIGARLAQCSEQTILLCREWSSQFGIFFQMIDDYLDPMGTEGKPAWNDLQEGLINFFTLELVENFPESKKKIQSLWESQLNQNFDFPKEQMKLARDNLILRIEDRKQNCLRILEELKETRDFKNRESVASIEFLITKLESRMRS